MNLRKRKEKVLFKHGFLRLELVEEIRSYFLNVLEVEPSIYLCDEPRFTCFNEICVVYCSSIQRTIPDKALIYSGDWLGVLIHGKPYVSPSVYENVFMKKGYRASIFVSDKGCKAFLYGRDILKESIVSAYPPLNNPVAVVDASDHKVIGVAEPGGELFKNVYDLGLFLRVLK